MPNDNDTRTKSKHSKSKRTKPTRIEHYPVELRGPSQNRHGGHNTQRLRGFRGNTFGAASRGRRWKKEEIAEYERNVMNGSVASSTELDKNGDALFEQ